MLRYDSIKAHENMALGENRAWPSIDICARKYFMLLRFEAIRAIRGFSKLELSRITGISPSRLSELANGWREAKRHEVRLLAKALRVRQKDISGAVELEDVVS